MPRIGAERRAGRRAEILAAAEACFARLGFHRATMRDVIEEAGLSTGCVYTHFRSKRELVEAIARERHAREARALAAAREAGDPVEALRSLAAALFAGLSSRRGLDERRLAAELWTEALLDRDLLPVVRAGLEAPLAALADIVRAAQREGRLAATLDPEALARVMVAVFHGLVLQQLWEPRLALEGPLDALSGVLRALRPAPGDAASRPARRRV
ncbi:MAG TPA: TetR/AcrR family transcriptional regulator [Myxococcota bacterium]|nr:TetR/AcrR family transcriptional regulator [Myxococcota bacterium]